MPSILNEIEKKAMSINPKDHSFPFENLVFEGGGSKGHAYSGVLGRCKSKIMDYGLQWYFIVYQQS